MFSHYVAKNRKLAEVVVIAENKPGVLAVLANVLSEHGINIVSCSTTPTGPVGSIFFLVDYTDADRPLPEVISTYGKLSFVKEFHYREQVLPSIIFTSYAFPPTLANKRVIVIEVEKFIKLLSEFVDKPDYLKQLGRYMGELDCSTYVPEGIEVKKPSELSELLRVLQIKGLGVPEVVVFSIEHSKIIIHELFEKELGEAKERNHCIFTCGYLEGFLSKLFGREFRVEEECCASVGKPYCCFIVTSR